MLKANLKASPDIIGPIHILYIEDEYLIAMTQKKRLEAKGYVVTHVGTGEDALAEIKSAKTFDLILSDIDLGDGLDGPDTVRQILETHNIPTIFYSSHTEPAVVDKVKSITNHAYVYKGSGEFVLMEQIESTLKEFKAIEALKASEQKFRDLFNNLNDAVFLSELPQPGQLGKYLEVNQAALSRYGYSREEFLNMTAAELNDPEYRPEIPNALDLLRKNGFGVFQFVHIAKNGIKIPVEISSHLYAWQGRTVILSIVRDMTERKRAEALLQIERTRFQYVIDVTNAGIWEWDVQTGNLPIDERSAAMLGYELNELQPNTIETWMQLKHPEDGQVADDLLQKHLRGETEVYSYQSRMKHKDGHWVWILGRGKVIEWDAAHNPLRMFGIHLDITEQKKAEEELILLRAQRNTDIPGES